LNHLRQRAQVHPCGLGAASEELFFHPPSPENTGTGWFGKTPDPSIPGVLPLQVRRGDDLNLRDVDFIKLDCECHEVATLEGLRETVARDRPVIALEWSFPEEPHMWQRLLQSLPADYTVHEIEVNRPWLGFFNRPGGRLVPAMPTRRSNLLLMPSR
jgi:hypothetical protein